MVFLMSSERGCRFGEVGRSEAASFRYLVVLGSSPHGLSHLPDRPEQHSERVEVKLRGLWSHSRTSCTAFVFLSVKPSEESSAGSRGGEIGPTHRGEQLTVKGSDTQGGKLWPHLPSTTKQSDAISIK